jgi:hypothetical protein
MTKENVYNLNKILFYLNSIDHTHTEGISEQIGLDQIIVERLIPILINRECIKSVSETGSRQPAYKITNPGKEYLYGKKFQKEYENELIAKEKRWLELKLLKANLRNSKLVVWNIIFAGINITLAVINIIFLTKN